jgi:hypothetical protein
MQCDSKLLSGFPWPIYNFQTESNKIKLLTEYQSVPQKVLFGNAVLAAHTFIFRKQFYFVVSGLKIIFFSNGSSSPIQGPGLLFSSVLIFSRR